MCHCHTEVFIQQPLQSVLTSQSTTWACTGHLSGVSVWWVVRVVSVYGQCVVNHSVGSHGGVHYAPSV